MNKRHQFSAGSENISSKQKAMPRIGVTGAKGARNGRSALGLVLRMINTAAQTITKASKVPIFTNSAKIRNGIKAEAVATKMPERMVDLHGVRNFSWTSPKKLWGTRPSRAIANKTRGWLSIITSKTE